MEAGPRAHAPALKSGGDSGVVSRGVVGGEAIDTILSRVEVRGIDECIRGNFK